MDSDLRKVARFIRLSRATYDIWIRDIAPAPGIEAAFPALTPAGLGEKCKAAFRDVGSRLVVVLNGLRVLRE